MKYIFINMFSVVLISCSNSEIKKVDSIVHLDSNLADLNSNRIVEIDSILENLNFIETDDYPVTNEMFRYPIIEYNYQVEEVYSTEKVWFTNNNLKQTLIFQLSTDSYRAAMYHFKNNDVPDNLISKIELNTLENDNFIWNGASVEQKKRALHGFIKHSEQIDKLFFITKKGVKLGDDKIKLINLYGEPDTKSREDNYEILEWSFVGDITLAYEYGINALKDSPKKTVAKNSFGYIVTVYFKNNKLVAQILENEIP